MMAIPNILTFSRIILTPFFIFSLFGDFPYSKIWALVIFVVASITDAYDGYYARKYDMVTASGRFLDPLADKILVSSAFISFAVLGLIDYWMVGLIIFRDLFVTGLRIIMSARGFTMLTSRIAKAKTGTQIIIIITTLIFMGAKGFLQFSILKEIIGWLVEYSVIYYLTGAVAIFTLYTGITYVYDNRKSIGKLFV